MASFCCDTDFDGILCHPEIRTFHNRCYLGGPDARTINAADRSAGGHLVLNTRRITNCFGFFDYFGRRFCCSLDRSVGCMIGHPNADCDSFGNFVDCGDDSIVDDNSHC